MLRNSSRLKEEEKIRMICSGVLERFMALKILLLLTQKKSGKQMATLSKFKKLLTKWKDPNSRLIHMSNWLMNQLRLQKNTNQKLMVQGLILLIGRSYQLYLFTLQKELNFQIQGEDRRNLISLQNLLVTIGMMMLLPFLIMNIKLLNLTMKIMLTEELFKIQIPRVKTSKN